MKKPVIRIYKCNDEYVYKCDFANEIYHQNLIHIKAIFWVLNIFYLLQKDENGQYLNLRNDKPIFNDYNGYSKLNSSL